MKILPAGGVSAHFRPDRFFRKVFAVADRFEQILVSVMVASSTVIRAYGGNLMESVNIVKTKPRRFSQKSVH